jgi:hypothetical protein
MSVLLEVVVLVEVTVLVEVGGESSMIKITYMY